MIIGPPVLQAFFGGQTPGVPGEGCVRGKLCSMGTDPAFQRSALVGRGYPQCTGTVPWNAHIGDRPREPLVMGTRPCSCWTPVGGRPRNRTLTTGTRDTENRVGGQGVPSVHRDYPWNVMGRQGPWVMGPAPRHAFGRGCVRWQSVSKAIRNASLNLEGVEQPQRKCLGTDRNARPVGSGCLLSRRCTYCTASIV